MFFTESNTFEALVHGTTEAPGHAPRHSAVRGTSANWSVVDPDRFAHEADCAHAALLLSGTTRGFARIYQENTSHTGSGPSHGAPVSEGVETMIKKHMGSSLDDFLKQEGDFGEVQTQAIKEVVEWQLAEAMKQ